VSEEVYCIECNKLVVKAACDYVFKTGFYKRIHALAICNGCQCSRKHKIAKTG
jgi:phosphoribosylformylglycinamidine (FGAM) synthase-like amidotransferase family enzyme